MPVSSPNGSDPAGHLNPYLLAEPHLCELEIGHAPLNAPLTEYSVLNGVNGYDVKGSGNGFKGPRGQNRLPLVEDDCAAARALGVVGDEPRFACPLPGHHGVADLEANWGGDLELWCDCFGMELRWDGAGRAAHHYSLADAYYSVVSGVVLSPSHFKVSGRFVWRLLMLAAAEVVVPEPVDLGPLPADASPELVRARTLFQTLCGVRLALAECINEPPLPCPLAQSLLGAYCRHANPRQLVAELVAARVMRPARPARLRPGQVRPTALWWPQIAEEGSR